jgi:hypothetical protein
MSAVSNWCPGFKLPQLRTRFPVWFGTIHAFYEASFLIYHNMLEVGICCGASTRRTSGFLQVDAVWHLKTSLTGLRAFCLKILIRLKPAPSIYKTVAIWVSKNLKTKINDQTSQPIFRWEPIQGFSCNVYGTTCLVGVQVLNPHCSLWKWALVWVQARGWLSGWIPRCGNNWVC